MVSGVLDGDDIETLERRLHATPHELNALFAQLLAKIDEVHYETFKLCLFHLDDRNWRGSALACSIGLITASMPPSRAITTCAEFLETCTRNSEHLSSLGKGLIEADCLTYASPLTDLSAWTKRRCVGTIAYNLHTDRHTTSSLAANPNSNTVAIFHGPWQAMTWTS
jgi:hypothetical protein